MRKLLIAGNWKMNKSPSEAKKLSEDLKSQVKAGNAEVAVCPPYLSIPAVTEILSGSGIAVGGQDLHWEDDGAFTGKISASMLKDIGCEYVIIGHSEQRQYFHETDETVNKKTAKAVSAGLKPIICIGETLEERESGKTMDVVDTQLKGGLAGLTLDSSAVIAYEPVWAIGTGKTATPEQAQEVHAHIRNRLKELTGAADEIRILYGGSMKPDNAEELLAKPDIDGGLIGGASLKADAFQGIIAAAK